MLKRSRVGTIPDMNRLSQAVQRAGIDPRVWCTLAYALDEEVLDEKHGSFIEVMTSPAGHAITCAVPQQYAGKQFGEHQPGIHKNDQLVVLITNGDPSEFPVVIARVHNSADLPSQLAIDHPTDYTRVQEEGTSHRLQFTGDEDGQYVHHGADVISKLMKDGLELGVSPTDFVALASLVKAELQAIRNTLNAHISAYNGHVHPAGALITGPSGGSPVTGATAATTATATPPAAVNDVKSEFTKSK